MYLSPIIVQFFIGWWIVIDAAVTYPSQEIMPNAVHTCGAIGSLAFFMYVFKTKFIILSG